MNELSRLINEGIKGIQARRHNTSIEHVYVELAELCARARQIDSLTSGAIRKWIANGSIPHPEYVEVLARAFVNEGGMERTRLRSFLHHARYFDAEQLIIDLFPENPDSELDSPVRVHSNLPQPNYGKFIGRETEQKELHRLLQPYPQGIHSVITIKGVGGMGKTALALEIAHYYHLNYERLTNETRFAAIIWFSAKNTYLTLDGIQARPAARQTLDELYTDIALTFGEENIHQVSSAEREATVMRLLRTNRTLLIIDNLETIVDAKLLAFLREPPAPTKIIVTTRHWIDVSYSYPLGGMNKEDAEKLITQECKEKRFALSEEHKQTLFKRTGGVPLAIVLSIGRVGSGYSVQSVLERLERADDDIARFCFEESVGIIRDTGAYKLLMALTFFPGGALREELGWVAHMDMDKDIHARDEGLVRLEKLSLVNHDLDQDTYNMLPLTRQYALAELSQNPDFDENTFSRWIEVALARSAATVHEFDGYEGFSHAIQRVSQAQHRIWLLNAAAKEESLEQSMKWIQQGSIYSDFVKKPQDRLTDRIKELRRLLHQNHYYKYLIEQARHLRDSGNENFEYLRVVQYPSGQITRENTDYHYLQHLHDMVKASAEVQKPGVLISVRLYESRPNRNKTFAIIDNRYILVQENEYVQGCIRMTRLRVIDHPSSEILQTFETIYDEVLRKSARASARDIEILRDGLPSLSDILHQPVRDLLADVLRQETQGQHRISVDLILDMHKLGDDVIHQTLVNVLHEFLKKPELTELLQQRLTEAAQRNAEFATWYQSQI